VRAKGYHNASASRIDAPHACKNNEKKAPFGALPIGYLRLQLSELLVHNREPLFEASLNRLEELNFLLDGH